MIKQGLNSDGEAIRSAYVEHEPVDFVCDDDGMTRQEFAAECDINTLMARYERTGIVPGGYQGAQFLDLSEMPEDLLGTMEMMKAAEHSFMQLPAGVRKEFDNDPIRFVDFASNPENLSQLREWGLAAPEPVADAVKSPDPASVPASSSKAEE